MSIENTSEAPVHAWGYNTKIAWVKFVPVDGAPATIQSAFGVTGVTRNSEGSWNVQIAQPKYTDLTANAYGVFTGANYHEVKVTALNVATGVATVTHSTAAYGSPPVLDDNLGVTSITVVFIAVQG